MARARVAWEARPPAEARQGDLADFVVALRGAAVRQDWEALRSVMARDFVHTLGPIDMGLLETFAAWEREQYRTLDRMPFILDRGVASVPGTTIWAAPPRSGAVRWAWNSADSTAAKAKTTCACSTRSMACTSKCRR